MTRVTLVLRIALMTALSALIGVLSACSPPGNSSTNHTFGDAGSAILALNAGIGQAFANSGNSSKPAYSVTVVSTTTIYFNAYYSYSGAYITTPYTLSGTLVEMTGSSTSLNGTVNFSGGTVTAIVYNNVTTTPAVSGTYQITFAGGGVYIYNLATGTFTLQ
jgi:hypothetical protein